MGKKNEIKALNIRIPKELWVFLKVESTKKETSMNSIIELCVKRHKERLDKRRLSKSIDK